MPPGAWCRRCTSRRGEAQHQQTPVQRDLALRHELHMRFDYQFRTTPACSAKKSEGLF